MDTLISNIKNPSWWINFVLVGLILTLLGNAIQTLVIKLFTKTSASFRKRRRKALKLQANKIRFLSRHPDVLGFELTAMCAKVVLSAVPFTLGICYILSTQLDDIAHRIANPKIEPTYNWISPHTAVELMAFALLTTGFVLFYLTSQQMATLQRARQKYRRHLIAQDRMSF